MPEVALTDPLALEQIVARQGEGTQELVWAPEMGMPPGLLVIN